MGRGLVEPLDDMEQPSWHPELLDWLAEDLVANGYDLKKTMARILTSRAYQLEAVDVPEQVEPLRVQRTGDPADVGGAVRRRAERGDGRVGRKALPRRVARRPGGIASRARGIRRTDRPTRYVVGTRAALITADPLTVALGRPNREQVTTSRAAAATTLQALELANGATLASVLERGAKKLLAEAQTTDQVIDLVYQRALGRAPTDSEMTLCRSLLGRRSRRRRASRICCGRW